jgi:hypothetical protein
MRLRYWRLGAFVMPHEIHELGSPQQTMQVVPVSHGDIGAALRQLGLRPPQPVLVVVGGAGGLAEADIALVRPLFAAGLVPLAERCGAVVIDGGTDAGVMRLMGQARAEIGASFPLIGVAPAARVAIPGVPSSSQGTPLESHHTHLLLVPGADWTAGAHWLSQVADVLAGDARSVTILVNGGEVAFDDVALSIQARRPVVVVAGTGRTAEVLARAARGEASDDRAAAVAASGLLRVVDIASGADALVDAVASLLDGTG